MSKRKKKKSSLFSKIFCIIVFLVMVISIVSIVVLDIFNMKNLYIVSGLILFVGFILILFNRKSKGYIISLVYIICLLVVSFYIFRTSNFIDNIFSSYKTYNYSVVVLTNSSYKNIKDLGGKSIGFVNEEDDAGSEGIKHLNKKIDFVNKEYGDSSSLYDDLVNEKINAMMIEDSTLDMLNEEDSTDTRIIYSFKIRVKIDKIGKDVDVTKVPFNIYISGIDTYGDIESVSRSDVNMIVTVNPKTRQVLFTSIPRDYYVSLYGKKGYKDKLTHAGLYGIDTSIRTIEDLLDIDINYYVKVNFSSVVNIVDAIGGVKVYSDYDFTSIDGYSYKKGYNKVNGEEALSFARERKAFTTGDRQRIKDQQALLEAIVKKCTSKEIIYRYNSLINSMSNSISTNMSSTRIKSLIKMQLNDMSSWNITTNSLEGTDSSNYTYSYSASKLYVMEPVIDSVNKASELITSVMGGSKYENTYSDDDEDSNDVTKNEITYEVVDDNKDKDNEVEDDKKEEDDDEENVDDDDDEIIDAKDDSDEENIDNNEENDDNEEDNKEKPKEDISN